MTSSTSTSSLLPDSSFRTTRLNNRFVVLSVSETGFTIGEAHTTYDKELKDANYSNGYYFFAESIGITSSIQIPSGLSLCTYRLTCPPGSSANRILISTTGEKGDDDAVSAKDHKDNDHKTVKGRDGHNGGTLLLYTQDLDDHSAKAIVLSSQGGNGGNARLKDVVGDGGNGGSIFSIIQPTYVRMLNTVSAFFDRAEFHPTDSSKHKNKVVKEDALYSEAKSILLASQGLNASATTIDTLFKPLEDEIAKMDEIYENNKDPKKEKKGERTVLDVKRAVNGVKRNLKNLISEQKFQMTSLSDNVRGGYPGRGIDKDVPAGKQGKAGNITQIFLETWTPKDLVQAKLPLVHPEQCMMLLQRANLFFYINSSMLRSYARLLYQRLVVRLSFLPLGSDDPLRKAYEESPIEPKMKISDLEETLAAANEQLLHVESDLNYHGYSPRWVPRGSYEHYKQSVNEAYDALVAFEKAYTQYNSALNKQADLNNDLALAYKNTARIVNSLHADINDLTEMLESLDTSISELKPGVKDAKDELIKAYEAEKSAIQAAFGLTVPQIISAFTLICMFPHSLMIGLEIGNSVYQGFTEVPSVEGTTINKEYLTSTFQKSEARIDDIKTKLDKKLDGEYKLDDPFAQRLIVEKEELLNQLDRFSQQAFGGVDDADKRKNLETKFDTYIARVTARNDEILRYNVTLKKLCSKKEDQTFYKDKQSDLATRKVNNEDPDLAAITAYVGKVYQASQARMMKLLDLLVRSLNFRMLLHSEIYNYGLGGTDPNRPSDLDNVPQTLSSTALNDLRQTINLKFGDITEHWGGEPSKFPPNFDNGQGKRYYLSNSQWQTLKKPASPRVKIKIPTVFRETKDAGDFTRCCNVRIYRVRFGLDFVKPASSLKEGEEALVKFSMTHLGRETEIVDRNNARFRFDHGPVNSQYSYKLKKDGTITVLDNGNIGECNVNETATSYAAPGPFATWMVSMEGSEFSKLDFTGVKKAYFDFCGTNYGYLS